MLAPNSKGDHQARTAVNLRYEQQRERAILVDGFLGVCGIALLPVEAERERALRHLVEERGGGAGRGFPAVKRLDGQRSKDRRRPCARWRTSSPETPE